MLEIKFNPKKLAKLNNPDRLLSQNPDVFWPLLELKNPEVIVDIGCGTGFFSVEFFKRAPGSKVFGLDLSPIMIDWIKENRPEYQSKKLVPLEMPEDSLPLEAQTADLAVMINLHHELHNPDGLLVDILRVLKPGAKLLIIDWKAKPTEAGPPLEIRAKVPVVIEQLKLAGFAETIEHPVFDDFFMVTGTKA